MGKSYSVEVYGNNEFADIPSRATFVLTADDAREIARLAQLCKDNDLARVVRWDGRADYFMGDEGAESEPCRVECDQLVINGNSFWFTAIVKHTDIRIETERCSIKELLAETAAV